LSGDGGTALVGATGGTGGAFAFVPAPSITSFSPGSGITGSHVTIRGTGLTGATGVQFGSLAASFTVVSDTQIDAIVPDGAVPAKISISTFSGTFTSSQSFIPTLSITNVSPTCGPYGTAVTLRGVGFTSTSSVHINGAAGNVKYINSSEVQVTVPSSATSGAIRLTNTAAPAGTVQARVGFTVTPHVAPTISSFSPGSGITGTAVNITGTNLCGTQGVRFGGMAASQYTVFSPTRLRVNVPNGAVAGPISVSTAAGTGTSSSSFTPTLSITSFSPGSGPVGTVVDIHGVGFTATSTVKFNGTAASSVTFVSSTEERATVPSGATSGLISLTNTSAPAGTVSSANKFTVT
jgi:hypothetical protein